MFRASLGELTVVIAGKGLVQLRDLQLRPEACMTFRTFKKSHHLCRPVEEVQVIGMVSLAGRFGGLARKVFNQTQGLVNTSANVS